MATGKIASTGLPGNGASQAVTSAGRTRVPVPPSAQSPTAHHGATDVCDGKRLNSPNHATATYSSKPLGQTADDDQGLATIADATLHLHREDDRLPDSGTPPRRVPTLGQILDLDGSEVQYRDAPLRLRVERVRLDISGWYGGGWVWLEGYELDADGHAISWQQALVAVAAIEDAAAEQR